MENAYNFCRHSLPLKYFDSKYLVLNLQVFLTIPLQALTTGVLKYKIKNPCWHQVSVIQNERQQDFVLELLKGVQSDAFTEKVKGVLYDLEHGGVTHNPLGEEGSY